MKRKLSYPIRIKILIAILLGITGVVGTITFNMARTFHKDKSAYIHDLVSISMLQTSNEARSLLDGYRDRLQVYGRIISDDDLDPGARRDLLKDLLEEFPALVAVSLYRNGEESGTIYDARVLERVGLTKQDIEDQRAANPLPLDEIEDVFTANSSLTEKLPTLTMAIPLDDGDGDDLVLAAELRLDEILHVAARSKLFDIALIDGQGALYAHPNPSRVAAHGPLNWFPLENWSLAEGSVGVVRAYERAGMKMIGGYSPIGFGDMVVCIRVPQSVAYLASRELLNDLILGSLILLVVVAVASVIWSKRLTRPIERLSRAAHKVGQGDFDVQVQVGSRDEIGLLADSFNQMTTELLERDKKLVAAQIQLVQSEKLAAFGQLGAGIAHEVKNPLAGILACAQVSLRKTEKDTPAYKNLKLIEKETKRCKGIIENLLRFARQEKMKVETMQLNRALEDTVALVRHQLELSKIELDISLAPDLPEIVGNAAHLKQVFLNLFINAQQAMEGEPGKITLSSWNVEEDHVQVEIRDTGPGIPEEIQAKIFEPFFTTKPTGKGTGLGLSVSYGIVKDHGGTIDIQSEPSKGTTFVLKFPVRGNEALDVAGEQTATAPPRAA